MRKEFTNFCWIPRVLTIIMILFVSMFALDSFAPGLTIWKQVTAFAIHLIPTYILLAILYVAWKWEKIGGIIFVAFGLLCTPFVFMLNYNRTGSIWVGAGIVLAITFPFIVVGVLYLVSDYLRRNRKTEN